MAVPQRMQREVRIAGFPQEHLYSSADVVRRIERAVGLAEDQAVILISRSEIDFVLLLAIACHQPFDVVRFLSCRDEQLAGGGVLPGSGSGCFSFRGDQKTSSKTYASASKAVRVSEWIHCATRP